MQAATDFIHVSDADVAMLFCLPERVDFYRVSGWQLLPAATISYGDPNRPYANEETVMMQFVSAKGVQYQSTFAHQPVHVGKHLW